MWAWILCLCLSLALTVYSCITPVPVIAEPVKKEEELKRATTTGPRIRMRKPTSTYEVDGEDKGSSNTISPESSK